jgi:hypothetical protein
LEDVGMRPHDDDDPAAGTADESLADGLGPTREEGGFSTSTDPYGDSYDDGGYGDTYDEDDDDLGEDDGVDDTYGTDSSYGDGSDDPDDTEVDDGPITDDTDDSVLVPDEPGAGDDFAETAHAGSPFEGIGFLLDEIGDALFGGDEDDVVANSPFDTDPADALSDSDLDLTGDGVVDRADLHEARSVFDFRVDGDHHHGHDEGVVDI